MMGGSAWVKRRSPGFDIPARIDPPLKIEASTAIRMDARSARSERTLIGLPPLHPNSAPYIDINRNRFKPCIYISLQKRAPQAHALTCLQIYGGVGTHRTENLTH